jgi:hypothetical protein
MNKIIFILMPFFSIQYLQAEAPTTVNNSLIGKEVFSQAGYNLYWGDLHGHTELSADASGNLYKYFIFARDSAKLDFIASTEHDTVNGRRMTLFQWSQICNAAKVFNQTGQFITLPGYEWTGNDFGVHLNVVYINETYPVYFSCDTTSETVDKLLNMLPLDSCRVSMNHPTAKTVDSWDWESAGISGVEIVGGNRAGWPPQYRYEYYGNPYGNPDQKVGAAVQDALRSGHKIGFRGNSDTHNAQPGKSGLTAVYATALSRNGIFEAITNRRTYATTGARIILDIKMEGHQIGEIFQAGPEIPQMEIFAVGDRSKLLAAEIVKNNIVVYTYLGGNDTIKFNWSDESFLYSSFYYVRIIQSDGHMAWSSPIWIKGLNSPPDTFRIIGADSASNVLGPLSRMPTINWTRAQDPDCGDLVEYKFEYGQDTTLVNYLTKVNNFAKTAYSFKDSLADNSWYFIRVIASDEMGGTRIAFPGWVKLRIENGNSPPTMPGLIHPAEQETVSVLQPNFEWQQSEDINWGDSVRYDLYLSRDSIFDKPVVADIDNSCWQWDQNLWDGASYFWHIVAKDLSGDSSISGLGKFHINTRKLKYFSAEAGDGGVLIKWSIKEENFKKALLFRSTVLNSKYNIIYETAINSGQYLDYTTGTEEEIYYQLAMTINDDDTIYFNPISLKVNCPDKLQIHRISPNPGGGPFKIAFWMPEKTKVDVNIYNVAGQKMKNILAGNLQPGNQMIKWDGRVRSGAMAPSGVYFLEMKTKNEKAVRKIIVIR